MKFPRPFGMAALGASLGLFFLGSASRAAEVPKVAPGGLWVLAVPRGQGSSPTVTLLGETHPLFVQGGKWEAPIAIYSRTKPGRYTAVIKDNGHTVSRIPFEVTPKSFPSQSITMPKTKTGLMSPSILHRERVILTETFGRTEPEPLWSGAFVPPLSHPHVTSEFGYTRYVNGKFWSQHGGLDLAAPLGRVTVASNNGRVILARKLWMRGNTLAIDHGMGVISVYNHLSQFLVKQGELVEKGQPVGKVGATGFVTGPHLHWEIRAAGTPTNPWPLFRDGIKLP